MPRRFQFQVGAVPSETLIAGFGILALVVAIAGLAGPLGGACLIEAAGAAFGAAFVFNTKRPWLGCLLGAGVAFPLARAMYVLIGASGC